MMAMTTSSSMSVKAPPTDRSDGQPTAAGGRAPGAAGSLPASRCRASAFISLFLTRWIKDPAARTLSVVRAGADDDPGVVDRPGARQYPKTANWLATSTARRLNLSLFVLKRWV